MYQEPNAWTNCPKAAALAFALLLLDWVRSGRYCRVMESVLETWTSSEHSFDGFYLRQSRRIIGNRLKPLFQKQRALMYVAIEYAKEARRHVFIWGISKGRMSYESARLAPGTAQYDELKIANGLKNVTRSDFNEIYQGSSKYGLDAAMTDQKANKHVGTSRKVFNIGVGYASHSWEAGIQAPDSDTSQAPKQTTNAEERIPKKLKVTEERCGGG